MERTRGFEIAKGFENEGINLPERKTRCSAGYDIESAEDCVIPAFKPGIKPTLIKTGIKAGMLIAYQSVKEEMDTIKIELKRKGIEENKGFSVLEAFIDDNIQEIKGV